MRARFHRLSLWIAIAVTQPALGADFTLTPAKEGGFFIERNIAAAEKSARGLATVAELIPLLKEDAATPENVAFSAGKKLEGVFTVLVGREDGALGRYEGASEVIIFPAPDSMTTAGDLTTFSGAVVFALKVDKAGKASAVQRLETGAITLSQTRKSL